MQIRKTVWTLYILGAVITESKGKKKENITQNFVQNSSDYDSNYQDYSQDRDYPDIDYYDGDREGRNLDDGKVDNSPDDENFNEVEKFMMRQLMSTIPGTPGVDYGLYQSVPDTSFKCEMQKSSGFYGDVEAQCQVFHICQDDNRQDSFLCPLGTVFNQISFICDWWFNFNCGETPAYYHLNNKFDSATGHNSMRETMKKMKSFQDKHDMNMIIGLAKAHKKFHNMQNMMKRKGSVRRAMSPKIRNLFMIRMRKNRLERIRNAVPSKRDVHELVSTSTLPAASTPVEFKIENSTEYHNASLSDSTTRTSSELLGINDELSTPSNTENLNAIYNTTDVSSDILPSNISVISLKSLLNMSSVDMIINGSILAAMKLDSIIVKNLDSSTTADFENATINIFTGNDTDRTLFPFEENKSNGDYEHNEGVAKFIDEIYEKMNVSQTNISNDAITTHNSAKLGELTPFSVSKPFRHENNFIIGNDTHISVSVTIHSNSGHSKLQWKRIPGFKRIRKVRFKNENENFVSQQYPSNDTAYRKRSKEEKPKSRVMWIPAMKNALNRKLDWKTFLQYVRRDTVSTSTVVPKYIQSIENMEKESFKSSVNFSTDTIQNKVSASYTEPENKQLSENINKKALKINIIPITDISTSTVVTSTGELVQSLENTKRESVESNIIPSINTNTLAISTIRPESLENIKVEALKSNAMLPINIARNTEVIDIVPHTSIVNVSYDTDGNETEHLSQKLFLKLTAEDELSGKPNDTFKEQQTTKELVSTSAHENAKLFNMTNTDSESDTEIYLETQTNVNSNENLNPGNSCRTICIKLFKTLNRNSTQILENATHFENIPSNLTSFESENTETQVKENYGRKSVLGTSPSEQWTVKYDPGPDCNENTESDKILVKGWSVIVDAGEVTKEKTVKRRHCPDTPNKNKVPLKGNHNKYANLKDKGLTFNAETLYQPLNLQSNFGSNDQRYWLNLVKNWLEQSPDKNKANNAIKETKHQNAFLFNQNMLDELSNRNQNYPKYLINTNQYTNNNKRNPRFTEQNSKMQYFSDLQTGKSDWSRITHKDLSINKRDLTEREKLRSETDKSDENEDISLEHLRREILPGHKSKGNQNYWFSETTESRRDSNVDVDWEDRQSEERKPFTDDDYEDWPSKELIFANGKTEKRQSDDLNVYIRQDWSSEEGIQDERHSMSPDNFRDERRSNDWTENSKRTAIKDQKEVTWPKSGSTSRDWSTENQKTQDSTSNKFAEIWKVDSNPKNSGGQRSRSKIHTKGRSVGDNWNWSQNKGYVKNSHSTREDRRSDSPSKHPRDINWTNDKDSQNRDNWMLRGQRNKPNLSTRSRNMKSHSPRADNGDWFSGEDISWRRDADSKWSAENPKDWKKSANKDEGNKMPRGYDWHSSEEYGNSKEQGDNNPNAKGWNNKNTKDNDMTPDWFSDSNDESDWSSELSDEPRNVFAVRDEESSIWPSQKGSRSMKGDNVWRSKSFKGDMRVPNYANHNNNRRTSDSPTKGRASQKPWNSNNQNEWKGKGTSKGHVSEIQPPRKNHRNSVNKPRTESPHWQSDFHGSKGKNKSPDLFWNAKGSDSFPKHTKSDRDRTNKKKMDSNRPSDLWPRRTETAKGDTRRSKQPHGRNDRNIPNREKGAKSWSVDIPSHGASKGNRRGSSKSTNNDESSWWPPQSTKGNNGPQQSSSSKGSTRNRPKNSWQSYVDMSNSNKSKGDVETKKSMWSLQIGSDGKLGNGWIPITIRPNLKVRRNDSPNAWNEKAKVSEDKIWKNNDGFPTEEWIDGDRSSKDDDFSDERDISDRNEWNDKRSRTTTNNKGKTPSNSRNVKGNDWSGLSFDQNKNSNDRRKADIDEESFSLTTEETITTTTSEINTSTSQKPEASFNQLFYIPAYNTRYKRSHKHRDKLHQMRETKKPYKIIKSGEILNDSLKYSNKFFLARAGIVVQNYTSSTDKPNRKQTVKGLYDFNLKSAENTRYGFNIPKQNENTESYHDHSFDGNNNRKEIWPKETIIVEKWSPYISPNFSASGWIPVTTFRPSKINNFSEISLLNKNDRLSNVTPSYVDKVNPELDVDSYTHVLSDFITKDKSKESKPDLPHSTFDILSHDGNIKNENVTKRKESTKVIEMKDGNKTLRVLSFSNVMKQFQTENGPNQNSSDLDAQENSWNVPITTHPKTYSLKLVDLLNQNMSNSWTFNSKENGTKKAWILVVDNTTKLSPVRENVHAKEKKQNLIGNHVSVEKVFNDSKVIPEHDDNIKLHFLKEEVKQNNHALQSKFVNWNDDSDWMPIIRAVGRVVSFNRTVLERKKDSN